MKNEDILKEYIKHENLSDDTKFYRQTNEHHLKEDSEGNLLLKPRPDATEMVEDIYKQGHLIMAKNVGPGLAFTLSSKNDYSSEDNICVGITLKEFLKQGGFLYPDKSSYEEGSYFLMLPEGDFIVEKVDS